LFLELRDEKTEIFRANMKTTNAGGTVIDEPKSREAVKPAVDKSTAAKARDPKPSQIYVDGKFYAEGEAKVSVFDHGLLYGDGIFEGIRFYNGRVFRLEEHLERLWDSPAPFCWKLPMFAAGYDGSAAGDHSAK